MNKVNSSRLFAGIVLIAVGIIFMLKTLGIVNFSIWQGFRTLWPIGLILGGIALILRMRWLAFTFLLITVIFGGIYMAESFHIDIGEPRELVQKIPAEAGIETVELNIAYGAGEVKIQDGSSDYLVRNRIKTTHAEDPEMGFEKHGSKAEINIERRSCFSFWHRQEENWELELSPDVEFEMELDYGASDMEIDLRDLKIKRLDIDCGATDTEIFFGSYPTKVEIDTGASSMLFKFPQDAGVMIDIDSGLSSTDFEGFSKKDGKYFSDNYDAGRDNIEIDIDAGASSIRSEFY